MGCSGGGNIFFKGVIIMFREGRELGSYLEGRGLFRFRAGVGLILEEEEFGRY